MWWDAFYRNLSDQWRSAAAESSRSLDVSPRNALRLNLCFFTSCCDAAWFCFCTDRSHTRVSLITSGLKQRPRAFSCQRKHQWITPERRSRCSTCCNATKQMTENERKRERDGEKSNWKARGEAENKSDCEKQRCWVLLGDTTTGNLCNPPSNLSWLEPRICRTGTRRGATDTEQRPSSTQFWKVNK